MHQIEGVESTNGEEDEQGVIPLKVQSKFGRSSLKLSRPSTGVIPQAKKILPSEMKGSLREQTEVSPNRRRGGNETRVPYLCSGSRILKISIVGLLSLRVRSSTRLDAVDSGLEPDEDVERTGREATKQGHGEEEPLKGRSSRYRSWRAL